MQDRIGVEYRGKLQPLLFLALKTTTLTLLTLGIYRFWARTRIRKYFWSSIAPDGDPLEYNGTGLEKFIGFLIAVAFLAVYLGILQLLLFFAGLSMFSGGSEQQQIIAQLATGYITFFAVLPLIFYAQYRARRYILARTRWRGVRFGAEQAAWKYMLRAIGHTLITIITIGILLPRQTFYLEKFKADRTHYGSGQFHQHGRWQMLFPAAKHYYIGMVVLVLSVVLFVVGASNDGGALVGLGGFAMFVGYFWLLIGLAVYGVHSFRILTENKTLNGNVRFESNPRAGKVIGTYILGSIAASFIASTVAAMVGGIIALVIAQIAGVGNFSAFEALGESDDFETMGWIFGSGFFLFYLIFLLLFAAFAIVCITQPLVQHYVEETQILDAENLTQIQQRDRDEMVEAEGFADALDVGAGF